MKRLFTSISIALYTSVLTLAGVFPAHTSIELAKQRVTYSKSLSTSQQDIMLQAFITVDNIITMTRLNEMGVKMNSCFGNTATVTIPLSVVERLGQINGVKRIELARHLTLCNDKALELSNFPSRSYVQGNISHLVNTGRGVVVGMIDVGIDFNHINFLDNNGNNRIVRVYMPCDSTGTAPVVNGMELPGSEYTTPSR